MELIMLAHIKICRYCIAAFYFVTFAVQAEEPRGGERETMVERQIFRRGVRDSAVLAVMRTVKRHRFIPPKHRRLAYHDSPVPIGYGQTISQPYIVAYMTEMLEVGTGDTVLEVGTGSGYQAAVLAEMGAVVYTVEIIGALARRADSVLSNCGYSSVKVYNCDGFYGLPKKAPFNRIIVTAAPSTIPPPLIRQLAKGGKMLVPVGKPHGVQHLILVTKQPDGNVNTKSVLPVRFVPLTRKVR